MPKIDWSDEDQPRGERFGRPRRRQPPIAPRPLPGQRWDLARSPGPVAWSDPPARRPLHLIWGPPQPPSS